MEGENQSHKHTSFEAAAIPGEIPPPIALAAAAPVLMLFLKERGKRMGLRDKERRRIYDPPSPPSECSTGLSCGGVSLLFFLGSPRPPLSLSLSLLRIGNLLLMASNRRKLSKKKRKKFHGNIFSAVAGPSLHMTVGLQWAVAEKAKKGSETLGCKEVCICWAWRRAGGASSGGFMNGHRRPQPRHL